MNTALILVAHTCTIKMKDRGPVPFSATGCQCFLIPPQVTRQAGGVARALSLSLAQPPCTHLCHGSTRSTVPVK